MTLARLRKLRRELEGLQTRVGNIKDRELIRLARKLGREEWPGNHPTFISTLLPNSNPISIPKHGGGTNMKPGTASNILDQLERDIDQLEDRIEEIGGNEND